MLMLMVALREAEGERWVIKHNLQSLSTGNEQDSLRPPIITSSAYSHYSAEPVVHCHKGVHQWRDTIFYILTHVLWCRLGSGDLNRLRVIGSGR